MKLSFKRSAAALLLACAGLAHAADDKMTLNFVNADIESTVRAVGLIAGKNFIIDPRVKGTINIVSSQPVEKSSVYGILLAALRQQGFTAVEKGNLVRILPEADAKQHYSATVDKAGKVSGDRIVTQVFPLQYESANQMVPILRPLISPNNAISAYLPGNALVITDYADNITRLDQIIRNIDQPPSNDVFPIRLKYASALDVAQTLSRLMPELSLQTGQALVPNADGVKRSTLVPDVRTNSLLIRSENPVSAQQIRKLIDVLDQPGAAGNIHVVYLKNAEATKLAATLKGILTGQDSGSSNGSSGGFSSPTLSVNASSTSGGSSTASSTPVQTSAGSSSTNSAASVQVGGATVLIQADAMTNSLIVTAPDNVYNNLRTVIDKLDMRRAQVYVEAMIAEVNVSKVGEFGVQWLLGGGGDNVSGVGFSSLGTLSNSLTNIISAVIKKDPTSLGTGATFGVVNGNPFKDGGKTPTLGILATALQNNGDANILSTPNLLTLDNEEAQIMVGKNIPIVTGTQSSTGSNPNPFTTVERKDIGITLKIKPQVSEGGSITLHVYQEVSDIDSTVNTSGAGIATSKRAIDSKVLVDNGQIIVLGGLIENKLSNTANKIPGLGDLPGLGSLFRYDSRSWQKTNLMVFLRPVVLRDGEASRVLSNERYQYLRGEQGAFDIPSRFGLPDLPKLQLPADSATSPSGKAAEPAKQP
ncbi:general secretion pathway protein D [Andreprevotia lacus DSM 23236]|jgi:general secretion pathway protein D|uniref:General secretion pathway protein D n=1 Tax=Andreprevotia lacus DSM 23236 TaxID=1121001 RepID=A0A1W1XQV1_9NEIS|nr:type II secretion system secretin GspD [Andreprevotia lacus]SMC25888.1 general secretion pathway protein D [Andreprevotia lacus DSM 23236]